MGLQEHQGVPSTLQHPHTPQMPGLAVVTYLHMPVLDVSEDAVHLWRKLQGRLPRVPCAVPEL